MATYVATVSPRVGDTAPEDVALKKHHVLAKDGTTSKFQNPHPSWGDFSVRLLFKRMIRTFFLWTKGTISFPDTSPPTVPVRKPEFLTSRFGSDSLRATWLGHACYYVEFPSGLRVLFDPVFEDRCSPVSFMGPKRYTKRPCDIADLPFLDAVVISHSHYDHLSNPTVREILQHHPNAQFFVGLGLARWFRRMGIEMVTELDWWQDVDLTLAAHPTADEPKSSDADTTTIVARISCLPCQHTSGRTLSDRDKTLWCSWGVSTGGKSVFFGGDTGYRAIPDGMGDIDGDGYANKLPVCPSFSEIGSLRGPFDLGLIPIGAYKPRFLVSSMHADPEDAVEIFRDTRCQKALGIHWGTWALTMEDVLEPPLKLKEALNKRGLEETGVFDVCEIGETREF